MPTLKFTKRSIEALEPPTGGAPVFYFDSSMPGFGLRMMPSGLASWVVEYRPGVGGRAAQKKRVTLGRLASMSLEDAKRDAKALLAAVTLGGDPAKAKQEQRASLTLGALVQEYLTSHVEVKRKPRTAEHYRGLLAVHIAPRSIANVRAMSVTRADVARLHASVGQGATYAANRVLALVSAAYGWAGKMDLVPPGINPASGIEPFTEHSREMYLKEPELKALGAALREAETIGIPYEVDEGGDMAKHSPKPDNRRTIYSESVTGAIRLLLLTGCRLREILNLRWSDIDKERGLAFLPDSKTGKKPVILSAAALAVLEAVPEVGKYVIASESAGTDEEKPRHDIKRPWAAISKRAGLNGVRIHDLRHTFASIAVAADVGLPVIGSILGHRSTKTTARYAHVDQSPARAAADLVSNKIASAIDEV